MVAPKVYVATSFSNLEEAQLVMHKLKQMGFEITHDWTHEAAEGKSGEELEKYIQKCADDDFLGVLEADLFFIINDSRMKGGHTELGFAIGNKCPIVVAKIKESVNIFFHTPGVFIARYETTEEALAFAQNFYKQWEAEDGDDVESMAS